MCAPAYLGEPPPLTSQQVTEQIDYCNRLWRSKQAEPMAGRVEGSNAKLILNQYLHHETFTKL